MESEQISIKRASDDDESNKKRKRSANFSEEEKLKFLHLLQEKGKIIISKVNCKDLKTNKVKEAAWRVICGDLNASGSIMRSTDTLKKLWAKLKSESKQYKLDSMQQIHQASGNLSINKDNLVMELVVQLTRWGNSEINGVPDGESDHNLDESTLDDHSYHKLHLKMSPSSESTPDAADEAYNNTVWVDQVYQEEIEPEREQYNERVEPAKTHGLAIHGDSFDAERQSERANLQLVNLKIQQEMELHELRMKQEKELFQIKKKILEKVLNKELINLQIQQEKDFHQLRTKQKKELFEIKKKILEKVYNEDEKLDLNLIKSL